jgi:cellulose synthase/poly-beta-1,6-N-acetylglucosamine synthase-like glycosyltransferase
MGLLLIMTVLGLNFAMYHSRYQKLERGDYSPKVGILLPLRGPDPYLERCLLALTTQNYPDFVVHIIVDNENDPARLAVEEILSETNSDNIKLEILRDKPDTCGLKNAALLQVYDTLPDDCEVVVQLDADSYPYPEWLSDLVAGLAEPGVGIASGFRWYSPEKPTLASLTRHVWNGAAILQMLPMNIGWGGSLAYSKDAFEKADVRSQWESSLCDDTTITTAILNAGYKLRMVPRVAMINEEDTDFRGCASFIQRQLVLLRLYHRSFPLVCVYGLTSAVIHLASVVMMIAMFATGATTGGVLLWTTVAVYIIVQTISIRVGEWTIGRTQAAAGRPPIRMSPLTLSIAVCLGLVVYPWCLLGALRTNQVTWRGITYTIEAPFKVRRENYEPFRAVESRLNQSL